MTMDLLSKPFRPDAAHCCEACVFGRGEHAEWCRAPRTQYRQSRQNERGVEIGDIEPLREQLEGYNVVAT